MQKTYTIYLANEESGDIEFAESLVKAELTASDKAYSTFHPTWQTEGDVLTITVEFPVDDAAMHGQFDQWFTDMTAQFNADFSIARHP